MKYPFFRRITAAILSALLLVPALFPSAQAVSTVVRGAGTTLPSDNSALVREPIVDTSTAQSATVMVYMIGSDLESKSGLATQDLQEMMAATYGDNVKVIVQTMGCKKWKTTQIKSETMRFRIANGKLVQLGEPLGKLDSTKPETLQGFIQFCAQEYPSDRNLLILWNHGAGPVYGFGCDELFPSETYLTIDEIQDALVNGGVHFDMVGMDACLMGCLEACYALSSCADYLTASEDFEPAEGWDYTPWLTALGENVSIDTPALGEVITKSFVDASTTNGRQGILSMVDLSYATAIFSAWSQFAYQHDSELTSSNYSWKAVRTERARSSATTSTDKQQSSSPNMDKYFVTDMMAVATTVDNDGSSQLSSLLSSALVACATTSGRAHMTGLSVTLPYDDSQFYHKCEETFLRCGINETYLEWLGTFADNISIENAADGSSEGRQYYDNWNDWIETWVSWEEFNKKHEQPEQPPEPNTEFGAWTRSTDGSFYYCVMSNGDITYQDPTTHICYYYTKSSGQWWRWHLRSWSWFVCDAQSYPTDLTRR